MTKIFLIVYIISISITMSVNKDNKYTFNLENFENTEFYGNIFIGSENKEMKAVFSTGTGLTWFPSIGCIECRNSTKFDTVKSTTFKSTKEYLSFGVNNILMSSMRRETFLDI
jgi:hypothetical protein